ncbi:hypothetical protein AG1IA_09263 [Rhizoctonia solani AG-1 IA]|uniref:Uncharacterized protein n=1 Tax=Thanatephorus cucumeris (strain AG1-IA) TaxID=983506 RepID=L8WEU1_THACA|nr:hypothetical protein AG1IA_09263 [Rhizoctonia solani AG-1 IA]
MTIVVMHCLASLMVNCSSAITATNQIYPLQFTFRLSSTMTLSHPSTDNPRSTRSTPLTDLKDILIFLDGTGKDGALDSGNSHPTTNVWQLCRPICVFDYRPRLLSPFEIGQIQWQNRLIAGISNASGYLSIFQVWVRERVT